MPSTFNQIIKKKSVPTVRNVKNKIKRVMNNKPLKKGVCISVHKGSTVRPNSANRTFIMCQFNIPSNVKNKKYIKYRKNNPIKSRIIKVYIPGEKSDIAPHSYVMFRPGNIQDLRDVSFSALRGKEGLNAVPNRKTRRSLYGAKQPVEKN